MKREELTYEQWGELLQKSQERSFAEHNKQLRERWMDLMIQKRSIEETEMEKQCSEPNLKKKNTPNC